MSENAEVDWRAIARERWPLYKIEGDGPFVAMPRGEDPGPSVPHGSRTNYRRTAQFTFADSAPA